jgi:hypothetical protein
MDMNRRRFLQRAGPGTLGLGSLPLLAGKAWADLGDEEKGFNFQVASFGPGGSPDRLILSGHGKFDDENVEGGGDFDHFRAAGSPPLPLVSTGRWKARKFVSFTLPTITAPADPEATHGVFQGGILVLMADFHPLGQPAVKDIQVEVVCNLTPAGASTPGKSEGVYLNLDGVSFQPGGMGVTVFTHNEG